MRVLVLFLLIPLPAMAWQDTSHPGYDTYVKYCEQCHGAAGDGQGYAYDYVLPRPRDFTTGVFKFRTTPNDQLPLVSDLKRVVVKGIYGTSMPAFSHIGEKEIDDVVDYIQIFYKDAIEQAEADGLYPPKEIPIGTAPAINDALLAKGKQAYVDNGCIDCHGHDGRADGPSALTLQDDYGNPIRAANLAKAWTFRGGDSVADIYRALTAGLAGTPMPSYIDSIPEEDRWALASYVRSMSPATRPEASPQVIAAGVETLPAEIDDPVWDQAEEAYFPMTAQIMWDPVNTDPTITDVHVKALHDGNELAMLITWDDNSFSSTAIAAAAPAEDSSGDDEDFWDDEGDEEAEEEDDWDSEEDDWDSEEEDTEAAEPAKLLNDVFAVQFPTGQPRDNERPYFVMGDGKYGVNLWTWINGSTITEQENKGEGDWARYYKAYAGDAEWDNRLGKGRDDIETLEGATALTGKVSYLNGRYTMLVRRSLTSEQGDEVQLVPGQFVPIAFWGWDGHNGEEGVKASMSAWYFLVLEKPIESSVYYKTAGVAVLTLVLLLLAARAASAKPLAESAAPVSGEAEAAT